MWKTNLALAIALGLAACAPNPPIKSDRPSSAPPASSAPDAALLSRNLIDAKKLVADGNWPEASKALQNIIAAKSFGHLSVELQHEGLVAGGQVELDHGSPKLAHEDFVRATALADANVNDWFGRLRAADKAGDKGGSVRALTVLLQGWPDFGIRLNPRYVLRIIDESQRSGRDSALPLLQALYDAHWKLRWGIEPSEAWRDLVRLLLDKGRMEQAIDVSNHITDVFVLISMRSDRRFDAVTAANASQFDIEAAAKRELSNLQAKAENTPNSLELQLDVIEALLSRQHYEAALAACDSILSAVRSTNYPEKLYADFGEQYNWLLDERADLLERVGRWDDSLAERNAASKLMEDHQGNVSQLINLAQLYLDLARPREALDAIGRMTVTPSAFGIMQMELVKLDAASQLGDSAQIARSMQYLKEHRADAPEAYERALIVVNQPDLAAKLLIERLRDSDQRTMALATVQTYAAPIRTPRRAELYARWGAVIARSDVQAAIKKVGRVETYDLEER